MCRTIALHDGSVAFELRIPQIFHLPVHCAIHCVDSSAWVKFPVGMPEDAPAFWLVGNSSLEPCGK